MLSSAFAWQNFFGAKSALAAVEKRRVIKDFVSAILVGNDFGTSAPSDLSVLMRLLTLVIFFCPRRRREKEGYQGL